MPSAAKRLEGRVAFITGGASGIGRAIAAKFVDEGAQVALADINSELLRETGKHLGNACTTMTADVTVEAGAGERRSADLEDTKISSSNCALRACEGLRFFQRTRPVAKNSGMREHVVSGETRDVGPSLPTSPPVISTANGLSVPMSLETVVTTCRLVLCG